MVWHRGPLQTVSLYREVIQREFTMKFSSFLCKIRWFAAIELVNKELPFADLVCETDLLPFADLKSSEWVNWNRFRADF